MNAPIGNLNGMAVCETEVSEFYLLRSQMLDCFADIEQTLTSYVLKNKQKGFCSAAPLSQKVDVAKKVPAGPHRSKKLKSDADAELEKLAVLLPQRASMVHSRMVLAAIDSGEFVAIFKNAKSAGTLNFEALVLSKHDFRLFVEFLRDLSSSIFKALIAQNPVPNPKS